MRPNQKFWYQDSTIDEGNVVNCLQFLTPLLLVDHFCNHKYSGHTLQEGFQPPHIPVQLGLLLPGRGVPPPGEHQHPHCPCLGPHLQGGGVRPGGSILSWTWSRRRIQVQGLFSLGSILHQAKQVKRKLMKIPVKRKIPQAQ